MERDKSALSSWSEPQLVELDVQSTLGASKPNPSECRSGNDEPDGDPDYEFCS